MSKYFPKALSKFIRNSAFEPLEASCESITLLPPLPYIAKLGK
jgi:hypothetical protein